MAVPASCTDRTPICGDSTRAHTRSAGLRRSRKAAPDQVRNIAACWSAVRHWRDIIRWIWRDRWVAKNFLLKIADNNVEPAAGEQIGRRVVEARLGELPVSGSAREIGHGEAGNEHYKGENNDKGSALGRATRRMRQSIHGVRSVGGER